MTRPSIGPPAPVNLLDGSGTMEDVLALLRRHLRPYAGQVAIVVVLLLIQAIGQLWRPSLNADIINNGVLTGDTAYILRIGGVMLLVTLVVGAGAVTTAYLSASAAMGMGRDVRSALFRRVQRFSLREV